LLGADQRIAGTPEVPFGRRASPAKVNVMGGDMGAADYVERDRLMIRGATVRDRCFALDLRIDVADSSGLRCIASSSARFAAAKHADSQVPMQLRARKDLIGELRGAIMER